MRILWLVKDVPADIGSAGRMRDYRLMKFMRKHTKYEIICVATSADYGQNSMKALGIESYYKQNVNSVLDEVYDKYKEFDIIIVSRWYLAEHIYGKLLEKEKDFSKIIIDTVDIEWFRNDRQIEFSPAKNGFNNSILHERKKREIDAYRKFKNFIFVTVEDEREFRKQISSSNIKTSIVSMPVHDTGKRELPDTQNVYFIGNFLHHPNIYAAIRSAEIFQKVHVKLPDAKLYIVGKHPPKEVQQLHNDKYILVTGPQYKLDHFLRNMTVNISPVYYGAGINGKVVEAMGCGIPTVTTPIGVEGIDTLSSFRSDSPRIPLEDGKHCFVCEDDDEMADSVIDLLTKKELRDSMSEAGRDLIMRYLRYDQVGSILMFFLQMIYDNPLKQNEGRLI